MSTEPSPTGVPADAETVVQTEDLTKVFPGGLKAVDTLNLSLTRGEIFGLLGPNGAGKTTTVGMLTTMVVPTAGRAWCPRATPSTGPCRCGRTSTFTAGSSACRPMTRAPRPTIDWRSSGWSTG